MHPLEKKTLKIIQQENLLQTGEKVIAAVSGGPDSMALLHILAGLAPVLDFSLAAAYVNHGLRLEESPKEENLVKKETDRLGVAFFHTAVEVRKFVAENKISIEHGARIMRYDFFEKTALKWGATKIALAHTADDQAEEVLLRLIRGTARKGLSGMKTLRAGKFIRPLLHFPKKEMLDYLTRYSIPFALDSTNRENIYLRNRIRNELLPHLAEHYNPDIRQTLIHTAAVLQDEEELLEKLLEEAFAETVTVVYGTAEKSDDDYIPSGALPEILAISPESFRHHPAAIQRRMLEKSCWLMGCEPTFRQIENLQTLILSDGPGSTLHLADGLRVAQKSGRIYFRYPAGRGRFRGTLEPGGDNIFPATSIPGPGCYELPDLDKKLVVEYLADFVPGPKDFSGPDEYLDADLVSFPLLLRGPRTGDRFHPLGAPGSKKLADFLIDQKIEKKLRAAIPVLTMDESILALPGLRTDHRFRITEKSCHAYRLRWEDIAAEN